MRHETEKDFFENSEVGDWCFVNDDAYIIVRLHGAEDGVAVLPLRHDPAYGDVQHAVWQWDGNRDEPTLSPSILHHSRKEWHGFLRKGILELA